ncbi:MAG TPA: Ig-like domain-containing protein [Terriglobales bacterium]
MKWKIAGSIAALLLFAVGIGCNGFFVNPTLTGLTIGPTTSIQTGSTVQMSAVGTYSDGSTNNVSNVSWSSSDTTIASISTGGLVTGVGSGQATITGAAQTVTGSATITVTIANLTSIKVTTDPAGLTSVVAGNSVQFVATGISNGQPVVITDSVTWSISPSSVTNASIDSTGFMTTTSGGTGTQQIQISAQDPTTGITGTLNFSITNP